MKSFQFDKRVSNTKRRFYVTCSVCGRALPAARAIVVSEGTGARANVYACQIHGKVGSGPSEKALKRMEKRRR